MSSQPQITNQPLPADLQSVLNELHRTNEEARQLVTSQTDAQLNWHPSPTAWSVAQCLVHLGQMNSVLTTALRTAVRQANKNSVMPRKPIQPGWFGRWFINQMEAPPRRKMKTPRQGIPEAHKSGEEILRTFIAAHDELRALIHEARDLDLNRIRFHNPFIGLLRYTVGTALLVIGA
ncbi:MAG TPA: DinB family protein, partial [Candidatus Angelobacter sp.]|nr:DinB family protein [Candidatus Angelobacter sp.]